MSGSVNWNWLEFSNLGYYLLWETTGWYDDVLVIKPFNSNIMHCLNLNFLLPHIANLNNFHIVNGLLCNHESFLVNFCTWILWKLVKIKAGNCKRFLGMKVKMWNSKSFSPWIISNIWYQELLMVWSQNPVFFETLHYALTFTTEAHHLAANISLRMLLKFFLHSLVT